MIETFKLHKDMKKKLPTIINICQDEWGFVYPPDINNENTYDLFEQGVQFLDYNDAEAEIIFKKLISKHPYYIDAYSHLSLAFENQKKHLESLLTAEKAYNIGKSCFPKEFNRKKHQLSWMHLENRPFLRACQTLGLEYHNNKQYEDAIELYKEILAYNKGDNQGIRYLLLEVLFLVKDFDQAGKLLEKYNDDWGVEFVCGKLVIAILQDKLEGIDLLLNDALECNKFVLEEIVKTKHIAPPVFSINGEKILDAGAPYGSIQEAYEYWKSNKAVLKDKRIVSFVEKHLSKKQ